MALADYTPLSSPSSPQWGGWDGGPVAWSLTGFGTAVSTSMSAGTAVATVAHRSIETESGLQHPPERPIQFLEQRPEHAYDVPVVTVPSSHAHGHATHVDHVIAHAVPLLLAVLVPLLAFAWMRSAVARPWRTLRPRAP